MNGMLRRLGALLWLLLSLAGLPYGLLAVHRRIPLEDGWRTLVQQPQTAPVLINVALGAGWLLWAWLIYSVSHDVIAYRRHNTAGHRTRHRWRLPVPLHTTVINLLGGAAFTAASTHAIPAAPAPATAPADRSAPSPAASQSTMHDGNMPASSSRLWSPPDPAHRPHPALVAAATPLPAPNPTYQVQRDDWLGGVASRFSGDFNRYLDIQRLNPGLVHDPNHIEPNMRLILPADARDRGLRQHATGHLTPTLPPPGTHGGAERIPDTAPGPASRADPTPPTTRAPLDEPTTPGSAAATHPARHTQGPAAANRPGTVDDEHRGGVPLPGGWIGLPFAAALAAAAAMVWLRRRHRHVPAPLPKAAPAASRDPDLHPLPPVINRIRRAVREQAPDLLDPPDLPQPTVADYTAAGTTSEAGPWPHLPPVGASGLDLAGLGDRASRGGLGLVGAGAAAAARALLVATLSSGTPADPDAKGQVVIPVDTLSVLLGSHAAHVRDMPRLHLTADLSAALTYTEELLIQRRRLLDEHDAADLTELRAGNPYHPPMPPVLLLAGTPPAALQARLSTDLHIGAPVQLNAVLLGEWPSGATLTVSTDGQTSDSQTRQGDRLAVLDMRTAVHLIEVLREAHTGEAATTWTHAEGAGTELEPAHVATPAPATSQPSPPTVTDTDTPASTSTGLREAGLDTGQDTDTDAAAVPGGSARPAPMSTSGRSLEQPDTINRPGNIPTDTARSGSQRARRQPVRIRLLGEPAILDRDGTPVPGLRRHARELLVYLTVHRGGANLSQIMEAFWPDAKVRRAAERLSTEVSNLRGRIRQAAGDKDIQPVVNPGSRYHLDADLVDIDVWRLIDAVRQSAAAEPAARIAALRDAVDAHTGTLADGHDYDWIEPPREQLRRCGIRARIELAELLADDQPQTAADLTRAAAALDPINEDLARRAMRALARIGDVAAIRDQLQQLRSALDDIDEEPTAETITLAAHLESEARTRQSAAELNLTAPANHDQPDQPEDTDEDQ